MFDQNGRFVRTRRNQLMLDSLAADVALNCCIYNSYFITEVCGTCLDSICTGCVTCCQQVCVSICSGCDLNGIAAGLGAGCTACVNGIKKFFGIAPSSGSSQTAGGGGSHTVATAGGTAGGSAAG